MHDDKINMMKAPENNQTNRTPCGQSEFDCSMAKRVYSHEQLAEINKRLPANILEAMNQVGWNALGIYEMCEEVLTVVP